MKSLAVSEKYGFPRYVAHQAYYSLIGRDYEWELMPLALDQGVGCVVWSPLGWGRLTGKIRRGQPLPEQSRLHKTAALGPQMEDDYLYQVVDALDAVAAETGKSVPQIALNWLLQRPSVATVVIGARNEEQLKANLGALGWSAARPHRSPSWTQPARGPRPIPTGTRPSSANAILSRCEVRRRAPRRARPRSAGVAIRRCSRTSLRTPLAVRA